MSMLPSAYFSLASSQAFTEVGLPDLFSRWYEKIHVLSSNGYWDNPTRYAKHFGIRAAVCALVKLLPNHCHWPQSWPLEGWTSHKLHISGFLLRVMHMKPWMSQVMTASILTGHQDRFMWLSSGVLCALLVNEVAGLVAIRRWEQK